MGAIGVLMYGGWLCGKEHENNDERSTRDP